jgi:hypothetical protein
LAYILLTLMDGPSALTNKETHMLDTTTARDISETTTTTEPVCLICGRSYDAPYRSYAPDGKVVHGCVARVHDGHLIAGTESARWAAKGKREMGATRVYGRAMTPTEMRAMDRAVRR